MNLKGRFAAVICLGCLLLGGLLAQAKKMPACDEQKPETLCNAQNTCGSASTACKVDVRKQGAGAYVKPGVPDAKGNQFFCVKSGTDVTWMSSRKNTGFTVDFGDDSPFTPNSPILGGSEKPVTVKASAPGCYKFDASASVSGAIYGMSGNTKQPEMVILP